MDIGQNLELEMEDDISVETALKEYEQEEGMSNQEEEEEEIQIILPALTFSKSDTCNQALGKNMTSWFKRCLSK